jgi:hypothetical protein
MPRIPWPPPHRLAWIRSEFESAVSHGVGAWCDNLDDDALGRAIWVSSSTPKFYMHLKGVSLIGEERWAAAYEDIQEVRGLDLRTLSQAKHQPNEPVEITLHTTEGPKSINLPLFECNSVYSALVHMLGAKKRNPPYWSNLGE